MSARRTGAPKSRPDACRPRGGIDRRKFDLGDIVVVLLGETLADMRDRLAADGFGGAAELVADLVDIVDDYVDRVRG